MDRYLVLSQFRFHDSLDSKEGWFIWVFFVVIGLCTVFGRLAWVDGWISWIRLENRANDECEGLVSSDISIIGFLVIMYDRYAEVYYTRFCKQGGLIPVCGR